MEETCTCARLAPAADAQCKQAVEVTGGLPAVMRLRVAREIFTTHATYFLLNNKMTERKSTF